MSDSPDSSRDTDDALRARFQRLRAHDARRAPPFHASWGRRPPGPSVWRLATAAGAAAGGLAAAAALLLWCGASSLRTHDAPTAAVVPPPSPASAEPLPLDFLLDLPSGSVLRTTPDFDSTRPFGALPR